MRILHLIPELPKGGAERICLDIVRAFQSMPHVEVLLATHRPTNAYASEYPDIQPIVLNNHVVPSLTGQWSVNIENWDDLVNTFRPDVIHSHLFESEMLSRFKPIPGIRYVTHCHDNMPQFRRPSLLDMFSKNRITELYERNWLLNHYEQCNNRFIAISPDTASYFKSHLSASLAANVVLQPNAIDRKRFSRQSALPYSMEKLKLVNIGSFVAKKNQRFLLGVVKNLLSQGVETHLTFAGEGPLLVEVQREAEELGLIDAVTFAGNVCNVENLLWESNIYVHSATYEPFGLVLIEAMAAGLPVVALDGHGNRELLINGKNGYLIDQPDIETFASAIIQVIDSKQIWENMSLFALEFSKAFDMGSYVEKLMAFYKEN